MILKTNVFVLVPVTPITDHGENMQKSLYHVRNLKEMEGGKQNDERQLLLLLLPRLAAYL